MRSSYTIRIRRDPYSMLLLIGQAGLSKKALEQSIAGAALQSLAPHESGDQLLVVQLDRDSHVVAFNEIFVALQQFGYAWVEASVTEWADSFFQGAIAGGLSGGAAGSSTKDPVIALACSLFGTIVGAVIGSFVNRAKAIYQVRRTYRGWQLVQVSPPPAQPGIAPAT